MYVPQHIPSVVRTTACNNKFYRFLASSRCSVLLFASSFSRCAPNLEEAIVVCSFQIFTHSVNISFLSYSSGLYSICLSRNNFAAPLLTVVLLGKIKPREKVDFYIQDFIIYLLFTFTLIYSLFTLYFKYFNVLKSIF